MGKVFFFNFLLMNHLVLMVFCIDCCPRQKLPLSFCSFYCIILAGNFLVALWLHRNGLAASLFAMSLLAGANMSVVATFGHFFAKPLIMVCHTTTYGAYCTDLILVCCLVLCWYSVCYLILYWTTYQYYNRMIPIWDPVLRWWSQPWIVNLVASTLLTTSYNLPRD